MFSQVGDHGSPLSQSYKRLLQRVLRCIEHAQGPEGRIIGAYAKVTVLALLTQYLASKAAKQELAEASENPSDTPSMSTSGLKGVAMVETLLRLAWRNGSADSYDDFVEMKSWISKAIRLSAMFSLARILRLAIARYVGLRGEAFVARFKSTKDGRDALPGSVNVVNVLSATIATTFAVIEYRYKKLWMTNVLTAVLAMSEIMQDSQSTVAWTMAKLGCVVVLQVIKRFTHPQWVDAISALAGDVPAAGLDLKAPIHSSNAPASFARLSMQQLVMPGAFIALALKYDHFKSATGRSSSRLSPYFTTALAGYSAGLVATFFARHKNRLAQPGLIYIAPATVLPVLALAYAKNELWRFFLFSDGYEQDTLVWDADEYEGDDGVEVQDEGMD